MSAFVRQLQFERLMWFAAMFLGLLILGLVLATQNYLLILMFGGLGWLVLLPYHAKIALRLALVTFASSLILPFLPGRPPVFEAAALLGWSGIAITLCLRKQSPGTGETVRRNLGIFLGLAGYFIVLIVLMRLRGASFMIFGSAQTGGKRYLVQFVCVILPLLFAVTLPDEQLLVRLFKVQCVLSITYVVAEFALDHLNSAMMAVLYFMELPWDGVNFFQQRIGGGIQRYQSLSFFGTAMISLLFTYVPIRFFATWRIVWLGPLFLTICGVGMVSGHRSFVYSLCFTLLVLGIADRFFRISRTLVFGAMLCFALALSYVFADALPEPIQRALYVLPAFPASPQVKADAQNTSLGRQVVFDRSLELVPRYLWAGRGFGSLSGTAVEDNLGVLEKHELSGIFYNGALTTLINSGLPGAFFLFTYLSAGTLLAGRIIRHLRRHGINDIFERFCSVQAAAWITNLAIFTFVSGSPEEAVRVFGLLAGILMACEYQLRRRLREAAPTTA